MEKLVADYTVEVDCVDRDTWCGILQKFDDANFYQTWSYGAIRWGENNLSHIVLRKEGEIVAAAQVRIVKLPLIASGIAYISWGPMYKVMGQEIDEENFLQIIRVLYKVYVKERKLLLRIVPNQINEAGEVIQHILETEGFKLQRDVEPKRTILVDLSPSLEELRKGLRRKWRQTLGYAEKKELEVIEGTNIQMFEPAIRLYKEMHKRKKFAQFVDMEKLRPIQEDLPSEISMRIMLINFEGEPVGALIFSAIGDTGLPLLAATANKGLKLNSSYVIFWKMVNYLKMHGCRWLDLGGINPERNPGGYTFKSGIGGKNGKDVYFIGQFEACENKVSLFVIKTADKVREIYRRIKVRVFK